MKIFTFWRVYFLIWGSLTALVLMNPSLIWVGYWLLFLPGWILSIAPSLFFYSIAVTVLAFMLRPFGRARWVLAPMALALPAFYVPHDGNQGTWEQAHEFMKDDVDVSGRIELRGAVALVRSTFPTHTRSGHGKCLSLCQRLLFDSGAERVLIAYHQKVDDADLIDSAANAQIRATAYFIERRDVCPSASFTLSSVSQRFAAGECIMSEETTMAEADFIYVTEQVTPPRRYALAARRQLDAVTATAERKRIIEKTESGYQTLFQNTQVTAEPLVRPLWFSGIGRDGGSGGMLLGYIRKRVVLNDFRGFEADEETRLFGILARAVRAPVDGEETGVKTLLLQALADKGSEKHAGHDLFQHFLRSFSPGEQSLTPTSEDIDVVLMGLRDERVTAILSLNLTRFYSKLQPIPDELIEAMANRILSTPDQEGVVAELSQAIGYLPEGRVAVISAQIQEMMRQDALSRLTWHAIARLSDGDPQAVEHYRSALRPWIGKELPDAEPAGDDFLRGPLVGLCRMGTNALDAKDDLLQLLKGSRNRKLSLRLIGALLSMGAEDDLRRELESDKRWGQVERVMEFKKQAEAKNRSYCP